MDVVLTLILFFFQGNIPAAKSQDIWALGILLYAMLTGCFPWHEASKTDNRYRQYVAHDTQILECPRELQGLIMAMLEPTAALRPTIEQIRALLPRKLNDGASASQNSDPAPSSASATSLSVHAVSKAHVHDFKSTIKHSCV